MNLTQDEKEQFLFACIGGLALVLSDVAKAVGAKEASNTAMSISASIPVPDEGLIKKVSAQAKESQDRLLANIGAELLSKLAKQQGLSV